MEANPRSRSAHLRAAVKLEGERRPRAELTRTMAATAAARKTAPRATAGRPRPPPGAGAGARPPPRRAARPAPRPVPRLVPVAVGRTALAVGGLADSGPSCG